VEDAQLTAKLASAGLVYIETVDGEASLLPPGLAATATSYREGDGWAGAGVDVDDPALIANANAGWFRLAVEGGLFKGIGSEFLVSVTRAEGAEPNQWWARVSLAEPWDIMGAGAATGILGIVAGHPAFVMSSLDGTVVLRGTTWESEIGCLLVRNPHRIDAYRQFLERKITNPRTTDRDREVIQRWLAANPL